jgi:hypothetical protein
VGTLLWTQSRDALEGADTHSDKDAELAQTVLLCIHKVRPARRSTRDLFPIFMNNAYERCSHPYHEYKYIRESPDRPYSFENE